MCRCRPVGRALNGRDSLAKRNPPVASHECELGDEDRRQHIHDPVDALEVAGERIDDRVGDHAEHDAVRDGVGERRGRDGEEGRL